MPEISNSINRIVPFIEFTVHQVLSLDPIWVLLTFVGALARVKVKAVHDLINITFDYLINLSQL